jgi:hypothetical protein
VWTVTNGWAVEIAPGRRRGAAKAAVSHVSERAGPLAVADRGWGEVDRYNWGKFADITGEVYRAGDGLESHLA